MKSQTTKKPHTGRYILLCLLAVLLIFGTIFSHFGGLGPGKSADREAFAVYAKEVSDLALPEHTRIAALGEATHGNSEFQQHCRLHVPNRHIPNIASNSRIHIQVKEIFF